MTTLFLLLLPFSVALAAKLYGYQPARLSALEAEVKVAHAKLRMLEEAAKLATPNTKPLEDRIASLETRLALIRK